MHLSVPSLVQHYGYPLLFLLVGLESVGVPLPGETALLTAAAFAAIGHLSIAAVIIVAAAAAIAGDNGGYWIGRRGGLALVHRYGKVLHVNERKLARVRYFFERHGAKTVFFGRFIALLRTWAAMFAGVARMKYPTFMLYNALGGIAWSVLFGMLGYIFGRNLPALERQVKHVSWVAVIAVMVIVAGALIWRARHRAEHAASGE